MNNEPDPPLINLDLDQIAEFQTKRSVDLTPEEWEDYLVDLDKFLSSNDIEWYGDADGIDVIFNNHKEEDDFIHVNEGDKIIIWNIGDVGATGANRIITVEPMIKEFHNV